jgi:hypothetical protein
VKPYKSKFTEDSEYFPAPKGFVKEFTGGDIYKYARMLPNGMYVELFGAEDVKENDPGFQFVKGDAGTAHLYSSYEAMLDHTEDPEVKHFHNEAELREILKSWENRSTLSESVKPYKRLFTEIKIEGIRYLSELATALKDHIANSDSFDYKDYVQDVQLRGKYLVIIVKTVMEEKGAKKLEKHLKSEFKDIGKVFKSEVETAYGQIVIRYSYKEEKKEK